MKVLVVGSGGREHALVKALKASPLVSDVFAWPGNAGILLDAQSPPAIIKNYNDLGLWASELSIDLAVIGPEADLVAGVSDVLRSEGLAVVGPSAEAAQLEGSKIFAKEFMVEFTVPTARAVVVDSVDSTLRAATAFKAPYILKADGLAAGKGVFICANLDDLKTAATEIFENLKLGAAGHRALLEQNLPGHELSVLVLTNGSEFQILPFSRDHKRLLDDNRGPNTGGMGVVAPIKIDARLNEQIVNQIVKPTIQGLSKRNYLYRGVIFIGVMLTEKGPQVLEYNVSFGDPETQAILPLLDGDWAQVLKWLADGSLTTLKWRSESTACIVMAAEGYPDTPIKGVVIHGNLKSDLENEQVIHAGTALKGDQFVTAGGRVLNVISRAPTLDLALERAYHRLAEINWPGAQWRTDIGRS